MTLYEIGEDVRALNEMLEELGGDISEPEIEAAFDVWFAEVKTNQIAKVDAYCALIREFEAKSDARANEAARLLKLSHADSDAADRLKKRLKWFMDATEQAKIETPRFKVAVQKNGGTIPLIVNPAWEADPASAPEQFHKVRIDLDKEAIREAMRNDEAVEGCAIGERGTHLRIR